MDQGVGRKIGSQTGTSLGLEGKVAVESMAECMEVGTEVGTVAGTVAGRVKPEMVEAGREGSDTQELGREMVGMEGGGRSGMREGE